jgi:hypothetical protein
MHMPARGSTLLILAALSLAAVSCPAQAQDAQICYDTADKVTDGGKIDEAERQRAHEACQRALAATSSVVQKYHLQEADFDILGRSPKTSN